MSLRKKIALAFTAIFVVICGVGTAVSYIIEQREQQELRETYGEAILEVCNPPLGGEPDPSSLPDEPRVLVLEETRKSDWHDLLPDHLRADDKDEFLVVACVSDREFIVVERCPYELDGGDTFSIERQQAVQTIVLLEVASNQRLLEFHVEGDLPEACPDEHYGRAGETIAFKGDDPDPNQFVTALENAIE